MDMRYSLDQAIQIRFANTYTRADRVTMLWSTTHGLTYETIFAYKSDGTVDYFHWRWTIRTSTTGAIINIRWWLVYLDEYYDKILPQGTTTG